jgi:hypothetical protein
LRVLGSNLLGQLLQVEFRQAVQVVEALDA